MPLQGPSCLDNTHNAARKVLDGFHLVADTISSVGAKPTKYLAEWTADQINPAYWVPNSEIIVSSALPISKPFVSECFSNILLIFKNISS